jgi:shikimate kinase
VKLSVDEFRAWDSKCITLLGMSGVGKTVLADRLRRHHWFHYSGDYRIGTRYLDEPILDNIKQQAMQVPFLRELLRSDSIYIRNNITVDNLKPVSSFLGKLGNPERGGLGLAEFKHRQTLHREAEIAAMRDVPEFVRKAREIYGYRHFVNDAGGSVCELDDPEVLRVLADHTLILYIQATGHDEQELIRRAETDPKPLYYRETFLDEQLDAYLKERDLPYVALIEPDDFVRWMFPRLFHSRIPRYRAIAAEHGYTVTTEELATVQDEAGFLRLIETVLRRQK